MRALIPALALFLLCTACSDDEAETTPPPPGVEAFMTSYFEVFDRYDTEDIMALYATDVTADVTGIGALQGADEVRAEWLLPFTSAFPDYTHDVNDITVTDRRATVDFVFTGTHQGELLGYAPTGNELALPITGTYDIPNDVVTSFTLVYDLNIVLAAIAPSR